MIQQTTCEHHQGTILFLNTAKDVKLGDRALCGDCQLPEKKERFIKINEAIEKAQQFYQNESKSQDIKNMIMEFVNELEVKLLELRKRIEPILTNIQQPNFLSFNLSEKIFKTTQLQEMAAFLSEIEHNQVDNNIKLKKFRDDNQKIINICIDYLNKFKEELEQQLLPFKQQVESQIIFQSQNSSSLSDKKSPSEQKKQEVKNQNSKICQKKTYYNYVPISTVKFDEASKVTSITYYDSLFSTKLICGQEKDDGLTKLSVSGGNLSKQQLKGNYHQVAALQHSKKDNWFILAGTGYRDPQRPILQIHKDNEIRVISNEPKLFIKQIYLNQNEDQMICIGNNPNIHFWQKEKQNFNWNFRYKLEINRQNLSCLEVNEQQKRLLVGDNQGNLILCSTYDNQSWKIQQIIDKAHNGKINCIKALKNDVVITANNIVKQWWVIDNSTLENTQNIEIFQNGFIKQFNYSLEEELLFSLIENKEIVIHQIKYSGHTIEELKHVGEIKGDYSIFCLIPKTKYLFCYNNASNVLESLEQGIIKI